MKIQKSHVFLCHRHSSWCHFFCTLALGNLLRSLEVWESQVIRTKTISDESDTKIGKLPLKEWEAGASHAAASCAAARIPESPEKAGKSKIYTVPCEFRR